MVHSDLMPGEEFKIRIPPFARAAFGGRVRLKRRFSDPNLGAAWLAARAAEIAALRVGAEAASIGLELVDQAETLREAALLWLEHTQAHVGRPTWMGYRLLIRRAMDRIGGLRVHQVTKAALIEYQRSRRGEGASEHSIARELARIQSVIRFAADRGKRIDPGALRMRKPRPDPTFRRRFDPELIDRALALASDEDRTIIEVAVLTGMRAREIRAFETSWIDWGRHLIRIPYDETFCPKGRKPREIPMIRRLEELLRGHLRGRKGLVFVARRSDGGGIYMRGVVRRLKAAGVPLRNLHDLRHYYVSRLARMGVPLADLQRIVGHSHSGTTALYIHEAEAHVEIARERMEAADRSGPRSGPRSGGGFVVRRRD